MNSTRRIALLFLILLAGVAGFLYYPRHFAQEKKTADLAAILTGREEVPALGVRAKTAGCISGVLPDSRCTPGAVFPQATVEQICVAGYSKTVRNVPLKLRKSVFAEYDVAYPQPRGAYEVDHLIPLAIGGNNDVANLFPEAAEPSPGFREKDIVEVYLQEEVCASRVPLAVAQEKIAQNWFLIYNNLNPDIIDRIRSKFRNWSE